MTIIFIHWGTYKGFHRILRAATQFSGCPITIISDGCMAEAKPTHDIREYGHDTVAKLQKVMCPLNALSISRWLILREHVMRHPVSWPVFCLDWDVMVFRNLQEAYAPFADCDFCVSTLEHPVRSSSAAYSVASIEPLHEFDAKVTAAILSGNDISLMQDMSTWMSVCDTGKFKVGNLWEEKNGSVFDHNIAVGDERYQMDGTAKKIEWINHKPHFVRNDGARIVANTIHCWGTYKNKTNELLARAI